MENFKPRKTEFIEVIEIAGWQIKLYTITRNDEFSSDDIMQNAIANVPEWLKHNDNHDFPDYNKACLIVHEGKQEVFSLLNWLVAENMMQNHVYLTPFDEPKQFRCISEKGTPFAFGNWKSFGTSEMPGSNIFCRVPINLTFKSTCRIYFSKRCKSFRTFEFFIDGEPKKFEEYLIYCCIDLLKKQVRLLN